MVPTSPQYDVCLSFAGENREYVETVAGGLREQGIRVFYDRYATVELWGKDLYEHLDYVYRKAARYCVLFISEGYAEKVWTTHERKSAQDRAINENREYILPARFDDTDVPGMRGTVGHVDLRHTTPDELVKLILEKLGPRQLENFLPPLPDRLFEFLDVEEDGERTAIAHSARRFFETLQRMSRDERLVVAKVFSEGCPAELPENIHVSLDLLRRVTGMPVTQITEILSGLGSLGFSFQVRDEDPEDPHDLATSGPLAVVTWNDLSNIEEIFEGQSLVVAEAMLGLIFGHYCEEHGVEAIVERLDFTPLASATKTEHIHQ